MLGCHACNRRGRGMSEPDAIAVRVETASIRVPPHVTWNDVDADLVVFNQRDGTYHALDRVASEVWRAVAREPRLAVVVADLRARYPDAAQALAPDVCEFVGHAVRFGLLVVSGA